MNKGMTIILTHELLVAISTTYAQGTTGELKARMNITNLDSDNVIGFHYKMKTDFERLNQL